MTGKIDSAGPKGVPKNNGSSRWKIGCNLGGYRKDMTSKLNWYNLYSYSYVLSSTSLPDCRCCWTLNPP
jgi:hypothetical protein